MTGFGAPLAEAAPGVEDPFAEARIIAATCAGVRVVSLYVPNGRELDSPTYAGKLAWLARLERWIAEACDPQLRWSSAATSTSRPPITTSGILRRVTARRTSPHASARPLRASSPRGLSDAYRLKHEEPGRYSWWDYRAGMFHKNFGMRIDLLLANQLAAKRIVWAEIDREARKGKPIPSDHAPVVIDLDEPGHAFDARWERADAKSK